MSLRILPLNPRIHDRGTFSCGVPALDSYLQQRAGQHQRDGIATTHVLVDESAPSRILGYCSLSPAQLRLTDLQEVDRKRLPAYPVPAIRMARLAVSTDEQGKGHGQLLVGHVVNLARQTRQTLRVRALIVDAKDERAAAFYLAFGFRRTSVEGLCLYLTQPNPATLIPDNERWLHAPEVAADLKEALLWASRHPASDDQADQILQGLRDGT